MKDSLRCFFSVLAISMSGVLFAEDCTPEKPFPKLENCREYNVFTVEEFIYWRYANPQLAYARSGVGVVGTTPEFAVGGGPSTFVPNFQYDPGFRVGGGVKYGPSKAFDLVGYYTWLYSNPKGSVSGNPISTSFLPNNWYNSETAATNFYTYAGINLNLHFDIAEIQSGCNFPINRYLSLRPYIALTSYFVYANLRVQYEFITASNNRPNPSTFEIAKTHGQSHAWSIGPKTGLDVVYHMTENWGIFSNLAITQQISRLHMKTVETEEVPSTGQKFIIQQGHLTEYRNVALLAMEIGPTWDQWFCDYKYHLYLRATYQASNLPTGAHLSFLNSNNIDIVATSDFRGLNIRAMCEF